MRIAIATLTTAVVLFFFGFLWWGMIMPIAQPAGVLPDQSIVQQLSSSLPESGVYFHPTYAEAPTEDATGPMVVLYYLPEVPAMGPMMGLGFAHMLASALLACVVVTYLNPVSFSKRFTIVFCLGLFTAVWADVGNMIWWHHPATWAAYHFGYDLISWSLAGLVIAALLRDKKDS